MMFQSPGDVALHLGPLTIHWYGVIIATAFLVGLTVSTHVAKEKGENPDHFINMSSLILFFAIICSRLYYVVFNWSYFSGHMEDIFKIWHGGLAIHGAIIGGFLAGTAYVIYHKLSFLKYADIGCFGLILGQAIGRWGNFFNSEAFGGPTNLPWKLYIPFENRPLEYIQYDFFHPTFLYESLWNLGVFCFLFFFLRKKFPKTDGVIFLSYFALYSLGRFFIEGMRTDSLYLMEGIRVAQAVSLLLIALALAGLYILFYWKKKHHNVATLQQTPVEVSKISNYND